MNLYDFYVFQILRKRRCPNYEKCGGRAHSGKGTRHFILRNCPIKNSEPKQHLINQENTLNALWKATSQNKVAEQNLASKNEIIEENRHILEQKHENGLQK